MSTSSSSSSSSSPTEEHIICDDLAPLELPIREVPGEYGLPFLGVIKDRFDYFYNQGQDEFFRSKMQKYKSTVFRSNMPPGPFMAGNPKVIVLLDAISFPVLFDMSKVEKKNILDGTFMPSISFTGGYRVCAFLDPSEPKHAPLKQFSFSLLSPKYKNKFIPTFQNCISGLFSHLEDDISQLGYSDFNARSDDMSLDFIFKWFCDRYPSETKVGSDGAKLFTKWLFVMLAPLITLGIKFLPNFIEDLLLHTFPLPAFLVHSDYKKLYDAFYTHAAPLLDEAQTLGLSRDEACHNLVFLAGFSALGGMKILFPGLIKWVGSAGESLHRRLADEIRTVVKAEGGVTLSSLDKMTLTKSVVYETLRIEPPVPFQYGKAKVDMVLPSHDVAFQIKKGEMIFGYQTFATKDPKIFENAEDFIGDRFMGEGEKLLKYIYWSNGREIDDPTVENKQCPAKDLMVLLSRVMLVELFLKYDTFTIESGKLLLGSSVKIKSLTKST